MPLAHQDNNISSVSRSWALQPIGKACHAVPFHHQVEKPPAYDRAVDELLALPVDLGAAAAAVLPGGAAAARRRQLAEACLSDAAALDDTPVKRRRLAPQRCFNCGSYAHNLQDCLKPLDQVPPHPGGYGRQQCVSPLHKGSRMQHVAHECAAAQTE